jgi:8-oxo-(d)GTP phosphatase
MTRARSAPPRATDSSLVHDAPTILLMRHAKAANRYRWEGPDDERPLTRRGLDQARLIAGHVSDHGGRQPSRMLSSPSLRCRQTLEPLAPAASLEIVEVEWLQEGSEAGHALDQLSRLARRLDPSSGTGGPVVACTHGDVIWGVLDRLARRGVDLGDRPDAPKASTWVIETASRGWASARFFMPEDLRTPG